MRDQTDEDRIERLERMVARLINDYDPVTVGDVLEFDGNSYMVTRVNCTDVFVIQIEPRSMRRFNKSALDTLLNGDHIDIVM